METTQGMLLAKELAEKYHEGQFDKIGVPYIEHIYAVVEGVYREDQKTVAYLHDIVEDTDMTLGQLREYGYGDNIVNAVEAITRKKGEKYFDFIGRVKENDLARVVKLADLEHNTSPERQIDGKIPASLNDRYMKAIEILLGV